MHHPKGSVFSDGNSIEKYDLPHELYLSDVNVLGAGDYFASGFIDSMSNGFSVKESVINAHKVASTLIKKNLL
jgi:sugar/nucleoside kinase (ribokinase family)